METELRENCGDLRSLTAAAIDQAPLSAFQIGALALCAAVALLDGFDGQAIAFAGPALIRDWHLTPGMFGSLVSLGLAGALLGGLLQGSLADRIGRRPVILAATALFGVGSLACGVAQNPAELGLLRFGSGLGLGAAIVNIVALAGELAPRRLRTTLIAATTSGIALGVFLGGALASQLIETRGWRPVFFAGGIGPLLLMCVLLPYLPESPQFLAGRGKPADAGKLKAILSAIGAVLPGQVDVPVNPNGERVAQSFWSHGRLAGSLALIAIFFINQMSMYFLFSWMPAVLADLGLPIGRAVLISSLLSLGSVIGGLGLSMVVDRGGKRVVLPIGYTLGASACALFGFVGPVMTALAVLAFAAGFFVGGSQLVGYGIAAAFFPSPVRARGLGMVVTASRAGSIVGPLAGAAIQAFGLKGQALFACLAVPLILAALASLMLGRSSHGHTET